MEIRQLFSGKCRENVEEKKEVKEAVAHRNTGQHHHHRTQSVLTRRPPHPARLTGVLKQRLPTLILLKGQKWMLWEPRRPTLIRSGMHLCSRKMVQYNEFPNRLLELVRIFTSRLMMRWRRLCIGSVGAGMIERVMNGNRSHIYRDMLSWWKRSRNHIKKILRDWMLTVGVSQNQKKHMLSKTLPNILSCSWKVLPHQCGLWSCFRWRHVKILKSPIGGETNGLQTSGLQMPKITYVHTVQRETISIREALEKTIMSEKMKLILKVRTQMVESIYKYFDLDLSESHRAKLYISTLLDPRFKKFNFWPTRKYVNNSQLCTDCI